jgi:hypothetical protein
LHGGASMSGWAKTPMDRNQVLLFHPTLDATVSGDPEEGIHRYAEYF